MHASVGSSPRGRGTPHLDLDALPDHRFIPARAGNTPHINDLAIKVPVHPRAGGEHSAPTCTRLYFVGSSPRGRGTRRVRPARHHAQRFIPARAGNTSCPRKRLQSASVHPRAGGEHGVATSLYGFTVRFIPARAGNTGLSALGHGRVPVHPRAGGEHQFANKQRHPLFGSSPRGRGTPSAVLRCRSTGRFIPARAGNTPPKSPRSIGISVHPRAGGEHHALIIEHSIEIGSSPRGRGTLFSQPFDSANLF